MTKKGIELPGHEGRWEIERVYRDLKGGDDLTHKCFAGGDHIVLRLLPDENPMPEIYVHDAVYLGEMKNVLVVTDSCRRVGRDSTGGRVYFNKGDIVEMWRDGKLIWVKAEFERQHVMEVWRDGKRIWVKES